MKVKFTLEKLVEAVDLCGSIDGENITLNIQKAPDGNWMCGVSSTSRSASAMMMLSVAGISDSSENSIYHIDKEFVNVVKALKGFGEAATLEFTEAAVKISAGKAVLHANLVQEGISLGQKEQPSFIVVMSAEDFEKGVRTGAYLYAQNESLGVYNEGVNFTLITNNDGYAFHVCSLNGPSAASSVIPVQPLNGVDLSEHVGTSFVVHAPTLQQYKDRLDMEQNVSIFVSDAIGVANDKRGLILKRIQGEFSQRYLEMVQPTEFAADVTINRMDMLNAFRLCSLDKSGEKGVNFVLQGSTIKFCSQNGLNAVDVPVSKVHGTEFSGRLYEGTVMKILGAMKFDELVFSKHPEKPVYYISNGRELSLLCEFSESEAKKGKEQK